LTGADLEGARLPAPTSSGSARWRASFVGCGPGVFAHHDEGGVAPSPPAGRRYDGSTLKGPICAKHDFARPRDLPSAPSRGGHAWLARIFRAARLGWRRSLDVPIIGDRLTFVSGASFAWSRFRRRPTLLGCGFARYARPGSPPTRQPRTPTHQPAPDRQSGCQPTLSALNADGATRIWRI